MASSLALNNFPGFCKEAIPQDWFPRGEEVKQRRFFCSPFYPPMTKLNSRFPPEQLWLQLSLRVGWSLVLTAEPAWWDSHQFYDWFFFWEIQTIFLQGTWVANRVTDKLTPVTDSIFCCRCFSNQFHIMFFFLVFVIFKSNLPCDQVWLCGWHPGYHRHCEVRHWFCFSSLLWNMFDSVVDMLNESCLWKV